MPNRDGSPTRAEKTAGRRREFHQARVDAASTPVEALHAGFLYLGAVIKEITAVNPQKADEITQDAVDYLIRQANTHDTTTTRGPR